VEDRELIRRLGGELVIFFNASPELVESWRSEAAELPDEVPVIADPTARLYDALGTVRRSNYVSLARGSLGAVIRSASEGRLPRPTSADMLRLGADAAVYADGEIARLHLAGTPDDRVALPDLVASLS
jgi:hypothetical protein